MGFSLFGLKYIAKHFLADRSGDPRLALAAAAVQKGNIQLLADDKQDADRNHITFANYAIYALPDGWRTLKGTTDFNSNGLKLTSYEA